MDQRVVFILLVVCWVNITTTGGLIYGFYSLVGEMANEVDGKGQLWVLCDTNKDGSLDCDPRDHFYANVFSVAVGSASAGTAVLGIMMDNYGPKLVGIVGCLIQGAGFFVIGAGNSETHSTSECQLCFYLGFSMVAMGGIGPYLSSFNIANLTSRPNNVTSFIAGFFNMAGLMFFVLTKIMDGQNVKPENQRMLICDILGGLNFVHVLVVYLLWPLKPYAPGSQMNGSMVTWGILASQAQEDDSEGRKPFLMSTPEGQNTSPGPARPGDSATQSPMDSSRLEHYCPLSEERALKQIMSWEWLLVTVFYGYFLLSMSFYFGSINQQVDPDEDKGWLRTAALLLANLAPVGFAWPAGKLLDKHGFAFGTAVVAVMSCGMYLCLVPEKNTGAAIGSLILFSVMRTFLFSTFFGYMGTTFGFANYGLVVGCATVSQACINQISLPLNGIGFGDAGFKWINIGFAIGACVFLPYSLTLGVWEWNDDHAEACLGENGVNAAGLAALANFGVAPTLGRRLSYKWGKLTGSAPRRMRSQRQLLGSPVP